MKPKKRTTTPRVAAGKSKKASARVTAARASAAAGSREARRTTRGRAAGAGAVENAARRQFQKTRARAIQAHIQGRGRRRQAKRDAR